MELCPNFTTLSLSPQALFLDTRNPRFIGDRGAPAVSERPQDDPEAQENTRRFLLKAHGVQNLIESILRMGFLQLDRIVVREFTPGKFVVVEGNRRLAAIKTILGDAKRKVLVPPPQLLAELEYIEVLKLLSPKGQDETSSLLIQGVRHISGVRNWGPYQQGRLIHVLVDKENMNFREAALAVGLSPMRVGVLLRAYYGMQQMMDDPEFGPKADTSLFSCFEQAYVKLPVREWLGWDDQARRYTSKETLRFFYRCIISETAAGCSSLPSRDIRGLLPDVVAHQHALSAFRDGSATIQEAYEMTRPSLSGWGSIVESANKILEFVEQEQLPLALLDEKGCELISRLHNLTGKILKCKTPPQCKSSNASYS